MSLACEPDRLIVLTAPVLVSDLADAALRPAGLLPAIRSTRFSLRGGQTAASL